MAVQAQQAAAAAAQQQGCFSVVGTAKCYETYETGQQNAGSSNNKTPSLQRYMNTMMVPAPPHPMQNTYHHQAAVALHYTNHHQQQQQNFSPYPHHFVGDGSFMMNGHYQQHQTHVQVCSNLY